jgi:hypothetical protein
MLVMLQVSAHTSEDTALNSKPQRLNRNDIVKLIPYPDSDGDISDWAACMITDIWRERTASYIASNIVQVGLTDEADREGCPRLQQR